MGAQAVHGHGGGLRTGPLTSLPGGMTTPWTFWSGSFDIAALRLLNLLKTLSQLQRRYHGDDPFILKCVLELIKLVW